MDIKEQARKVAAGAGVALATAGLSNCNDGGAVDPPPPPLQCNSVGNGQQLGVTANRTADTVSITVRNNSDATWRVDRVEAVSGGAILSTTLPGSSNQQLGILFKLDSSSTTEARFTINATLTGRYAETCALTRTFILTISGSGVQVSAADVDPLPLAARQKASIVIARQEGNLLELFARTPYLGASDIRWSVTEGDLDTHTGETVRWTLPSNPGMYQAELVIDYGNDGVAFDAVVIEVN